jgi:predicted Zn-dependent protease
MFSRAVCSVFFLLTSGALFAQSAGSCEQEYQACLSQAITWYKSGRLADAAEALSHLHEQDANDIRVSTLLAEILIRIGRSHAAIEVLRGIVKPDDPDVLYLLALALIRDRQMVAGRDAIARLLEKEDSAEVRVMVASMEIDAGDYDAALANLAHAMERNPRLPEAHYWRARALFESGDATGAEQSAREELAISSDSFETNLLLGRILRARHKTSESLTCLERAVAIQPRSELARIQLAEVVIDAGHADRAILMLDEVQQHAGSSSALHQALARAYRELGQTSEAARERALAAVSPTAQASVDADVLDMQHLHDQLLEKLRGAVKAP